MLAVCCRGCCRAGRSPGRVPQLPSAPRALPSCRCRARKAMHVSSTAHRPTTAPAVQGPREARRQHDLHEHCRPRLQVRQDADAVQSRHLGLPVRRQGQAPVRFVLSVNCAHPRRRRRLGPPRRWQVRPSLGRFPWAGAGLQAMPVSLACALAHTAGAPTS